MAEINIVTDSSVYFPNPIYPGQANVSVVPLQVKIGRDMIADSKDPKDHKKWLSINDPLSTRLIPPSVEEFCQVYQSLGRKHVDILVLTHASSLSPVFENASIAARMVKTSGAILVIDSNTFGAGLGYLVHAAADAVANNHDFATVCQIVRRLIPHVYTAVFLPRLHYLAQSGFLDPAQAIVGEMLEIIPFYILDSGSMVSVQKAKTSRQLIDMIFEFVTEFSGLSHVSLLQGFPPYEQEMRTLKERISQSLPETTITEHHLNLALMAQIGPEVLGIMALENPDNSI
jgi:DegV family protein with EDD domain